MLTYDWCCFACGNVGTASELTCAACGCPAVATVSQVEHFRSKFECDGNSVLPAATHLHEPPELSALEVLLVPIGMLLFGYIPRRLLVPPRSKPPSAKS